MTNLELIRIIRKPGRILVPVVVPGDVVHVVAEKADLIDILQASEPGEQAPWRVVKTLAKATYLDAAQEA